MATSPFDIEKIPGFLDWFVGEPDASRGVPAAVVEAHGMGCTFSRSPTEEEQTEILGFLREHAAGHKELRLKGTLAEPLAQISGVRIDELRTAMSEIEDGYTADMQSMVGLAFGARRDAAERKCASLGPMVFGAEIVEGDGKCAVIGKLQIPLSQGLGTVAEIQRYIELTRKEVGDEAAFDVPPVFLAEVYMGFRERASAQAACERLGAIGVKAEVVERVTEGALWDVVRWQERWKVKTGRVEELMRPRVLSTTGFLGKTERLEDVLKEDASTLSSLGVTGAEVAGRIREIVGEALRRSRKGAWEKDTHVIGKFRVRLTQWRGYQECPWLCTPEPKWSSIDFVIEDGRTGVKLGGPGLIVHLIEEHGFFEGKDSPYRVDPREAVEVLGLPGNGWDRFWWRVFSRLRAFRGPIA